MSHDTNVTRVDPPSHPGALREDAQRTGRLCAILKAFHQLLADFTEDLALATLREMGGASTLVGLLPTGSTVLMADYSPIKRRGF